MENGGRGGGTHSIPPSGGTAQADHRHPEGHVGSPRGSLARLPQHCHQGVRAAIAIPGLPKGKNTARIQ